MTDHEMLLLRAAVEACQERGLDLRFGARQIAAYQRTQNHPVLVSRRITTFSATLTALLRDLGAAVPEWPSEERVAELRATYVSNPDLTIPDVLALRGGS